MFKGLITYWVIGCILLGLGIAQKENNCPNWRSTLNDDLDGLAFIAIWPAIIGYMIAIDDSHHGSCESVK